MAENLQKIEKPKFNRWLVVVAAIVLELALGAIYTWSTYKPVLAAVGWTSFEQTLPYSTSLAIFAIFTILAGKLKEKIGTKMLIVLSALCLGTGYILAGILPLTPFILTITIGVLGGAGIGLSYAIPIAAGIKWFPDKKGLVTGLGMAGFGSGSLIWQYAYTGIFDKLKNYPSYDVLTNPLNSAEQLIVSDGFQLAFLIFGVCYIVMIGFGYFFLSDPPEGYQISSTTSAAQKSTDTKISKQEESIEMTSKEMIKTPQYIMIFVSMLFGVGAGLMTIGLAKSWPIQEGVSRAIASFAAAFIYPLFNGVGRIVWGIFTEKLHWKRALILMNIIQASMLIIFVFIVGSPVGAVIGLAVIAFNYGGNFSLFPQATADTFGTKNLSANYGWVFLSYGLGGVLLPMIGAVFASNQEWAFILSAIFIVITTAIMVFLYKPIEKSDNKN